MIRLTAVLLLLAFAAVPSQAQDSLRQGQRHMVSLNTLSYLGSFAPRWNVGYAHRINNRWWAGVEAGYGSFWSSVHGRENELLTRDFRLYEIRPQVFYDLRARGKLKHLLSVELFYINHTDRFENEWYHDKSNTTHYEYDAADYKRVKTGVNLNLNTVYYLGKHFVLWQQIGAGIRHRKVGYSNFTNLRVSDRYNDGEEHFEWFGERDYARKEGSYIGFNFNLELKLAYIF